MRPLSWLMRNAVAHGTDGWQRPPAHVPAGTFKALARRGLAEVDGADRPGALRYRLTAAGLLERRRILASRGIRRAERSAA